MMLGKTYSLSNDIQNCRLPLIYYVLNKEAINYQIKYHTTFIAFEISLILYITDMHFLFVRFHCFKYFYLQANTCFRIITIASDCTIVHGVVLVLVFITCLTEFN